MASMASIQASFDRFRDRVFPGKIVNRATANLPQSTAHALFTVTGKCLVTLLFGEVTSVIQTQANNTKITWNPTAAGASVDLCANLSITAMAVGIFFSLPAAKGTAMVAQAFLGDPIPSFFVVDDGTIDLACAASNSGKVAWTIGYIALEDGAKIVAA